MIKDTGKARKLRHNHSPPILLINPSLHFIGVTSCAIGVKHMKMQIVV